MWVSASRFVFAFDESSGTRALARNSNARHSSVLLSHVTGALGEVVWLSANGAAFIASLGQAPQVLCTQNINSAEGAIHSEALSTIFRGYNAVLIMTNS
jgi:hypothetical protein